jgi:hypothetical protein
MPDWNPQNSEEWARAFGLVALPYFGRHRMPKPPGTHLMMQDGEVASFALHLASPNQLLESERPLEWAWSSHVRHAVVLDPRTKATVVRRWDDPSYKESRVIASVRDARDLIRDIERLLAPPSGQDVIDRTLRAFTLLRDAIEERGGSGSDVVLAFNTSLLLAEQWRDSPEQLRAIELAKAVEQLRGQHRPGFDTSIVTGRVRDYPIGEFTRILLEQGQGGAPYLLNADLLIRHASGLLFQEAHRRLANPSPPVRQYSLFPDPLPSSPGGRREPPPRTVHYTPPWLARALAEFALKNSTAVGRRHLDVLDPACGSGVFLIETVRELERSSPERLRLRGMDLSQIAEIITTFCVGEASRDLASTAVSQSISYGRDSLSETDWGQPDIILMNPPFKAWKDLDENERAVVKRTLGPLKVGRPDLYLAFIVRAAAALKPGGVLASVVPSAFFSVRSASKVRRLLSGGEFRVRLIGLFQGFETFDRAQVEAGVLVVSKSKVDAPVSVLIANRGYAEKAVRLLRARTSNSPVKRQGVEIYDVGAEHIKNDVWPLHHRSDLQFAESLASRTSTRVKDFFTVRLGIRGIGGRGHKKVLWLNVADYGRLVRTADEGRFFRPTADRIERGRVVPSGYVFYPYAPDGRLLLTTEKEVATAAPNFYQEILLPARHVLLGRRSMNRGPGGNPNRNWWEPSEPVLTWLASHTPRIVSQEFGRPKKGNFAFDEDGRYAVLGGTGWCWKEGSPSSDVMLAYLALLNSRVFDRLLKLYCPVLKGKQYRLEGRFVHEAPIPDFRSGADVLTGIGRRIHTGEIYDEDALDAAVLAAYATEGGIDGGTPKTTQDQPPDQGQSLAQTFARLASRWKKDTLYDSSIAVMANHPAYRQIIDMGPAAIPLILRDLKRRPALWFDALRTLTGADPVPVKSRGALEEMRAAWLEWGRNHGYEL